MTAVEKIQNIVTSHPVVLFMKGTPKFPQCGFSGKAVQLLSACQVNDFHSVNVFEDPQIREAVKEYANWPTIPQLYVKGEFIGGADILTEMYINGELQELLKG